MIQLTATHRKIIERQEHGWPDSKIRRYAGLHRDSDWLGVLQVINAWKVEQAIPPDTAKQAIGVVGLDAEAWRVVCKAKRPMLACEVGMQIGLSAKETIGILIRLQSQKLVKFMRPTKKGEAGLWRAA